MIAVLVLAGLASGSVTGLTGGNGMSVMMSILLVAGLPVHEVVGVCLLVQAFTMGVALVPLVRTAGLAQELVPVLCLPALALSWVGARVALWTDPRVLLWAVTVALGLIGALLLRAKHDRPEPTPRDLEARDLASIGALGGASGFLAGMLGGGGNIVVANVLYGGMGIPFRRALALSLCLGVVAALSGSLPYVLEGRVDLALAPWILSPSLGATWIAGRYAARLPIHQVRRAQGAHLTAVALLLVARQVL